MFIPIKTLFRDDRQFQLFALLLLSSLFCFLLIGIRMHFQAIRLSDIQQFENFFLLGGTSTFLFLVWNLFLAWIPYLIALRIEPIYQKGASWWLVAALLAWLLFFPNAPYMITDLLHLHGQPLKTPLLDILLLLSFAWTGLMLGYLSLFEVQRLMSQLLPKGWNWTLTLCAIWLCAVGVFIGRYLRWNSWDVLLHPISLLQDVSRYLFPFTLDSHTLAAISGFSLFLLIGYLVVSTLLQEAVLIKK